MKPDKRKPQHQPSQPTAAKVAAKAENPSSSVPKPPEAKAAADTFEPTVSSNSVPVWMFISLGLLVFWGALYLDSYGGGFSSRVYPPYLSEKQLADLAPKDGGDVMGKGKDVYSRTCMPCHQPTGMGTPGTFPPLAGSDWAQAPGPNRIIRIVLNGLQGPLKVNGTDWNNAMVPWRDTLSDQEIAAVVSYIRNEWGNKGSVVKPEQVKAIRDETKAKDGQWIAEDLMKESEGP